MATSKKAAPQQATGHAEPAAETPNVLTVEAVVQQQLAQFNISDALIAQLQDDYGKLTIAGVSDSETYQTALQAISRVRSLRTGVEATRKAIKEPFLNAGRAIDSEAKRITAALEPIEEHLKSQVQAIDEERERIRKAEEIRRSNLLTASGFTLVGQMYVAGAVVVHWDDAIKLSVEAFEKVVADGKAAIEAQRQEQERQRQEQERIAKEREELERMKAELAAREAALAAKEQTPVQLEPVAGHPPAWKVPQGEQQFTTPASSRNVGEGGYPEPQAPNRETVAVRSQSFTNTPVGSGEYRPAPGIFPQPTATPANPIAAKSAYFMDGFEAAKAKIIKVFTEDATPRKRAEWVEIFKNLKP